MSTETLSPTDSITETSEASLTPKRAANILYNTFKFSQGSPKLADDLTSFVHILHPDWKMDDQLKQRTIALVTPRIKDYVVEHGKRILHTLIPEDTLEPEITESADRTQEILNSDESDDEHVLLNRIRDRIIARDYRFLTQVITRNELQFYGRPRDGVNKDTPAGNTMFSFIAYYGTEGHSTGVEEFNEMFRRIKASIDNGMDESPVQKMAYDMILAQYIPTRELD